MKNVLFDLEGTLIDSQKLQIRVLKTVFKHFGVGTYKMDMVALIGPPLINTFEKYFGKENAQTAMNYYMQVFNEIEIKDIYVNAEMKKVLPLLKSCGFKLYTTSLQVVEIVKRELEYLGILDYFDAVVGDDKEKPYTSKTELVKKLIKSKNFDKDATVLVGDTEFDRVCAEKNKIKFIGVGWGYGLKGEDCANSAEELLNKIDE